MPKDIVPECQGLKRGALHPFNPNFKLWRYTQDYPNGWWVDHEKFDRFQAQTREAQRARQETFKGITDKMKRGTPHPHNGLIFWQYAAGCKNGEMWVTPERFAEKTLKGSEYQRENADQCRQTKTRFRERHKDRLKEANQRYNKIARERRPDYEKNRAAKDPLFNLSRRVRSRIREALRDRRIKKSRKAVDTIGCGWGELRDHLESRFTEGMSWSNMALWHVDHVLPLSLAKTESEVMELCHFTNLQPLWAKDNLSKGARR